MKKSPVKKPKQQQQEVLFKDAVTDLLNYMYLGAGNFNYSPIQLNTEDKKEKPFSFEEPACSQQLIHFNMDLNTNYNQAKSEQNSQKEVVNNNINWKPQNKTPSTPKKGAGEGKLLGDVLNTLDASIKSKQVSERIIKSHLETNAQARIYNNQLSPYNRTNAEKQKLFAEREKFRQNYRK